MYDEKSFTKITTHAQCNRFALGRETVINAKVSGHPVVLMIAAGSLISVTAVYSQM